MRIILTKYIFACYTDIFNEISLKFKVIRIFIIFTNSLCQRMRLELLNIVYLDWNNNGYKTKIKSKIPKILNVDFNVPV